MPNHAENDPTARLEEFRDAIIIKAEYLVIYGFPQKILELNEVLATPLFSARQCALRQDDNISQPDSIIASPHEDCTEPAPKRPRIDYFIGDTVVCNDPLCEMIKIVKPIIRKLVEHSNLLKMWISFMIPHIEDEDRFTPTEQDDTIAAIQAVESEAGVFFDQISRYFLSRGKVVSKISKYPHIDDYRRAVIELDEKEYLSLWLVVSEVRNRYSSLYDIVVRDMEKLGKPQPSNSNNSF